MGFAYRVSALVTTNAATDTNSWSAHWPDRGRRVGNSSQHRVYGKTPDGLAARLTGLPAGETVTRMPLV